MIKKYAFIFVSFCFSLTACQNNKKNETAHRLIVQFDNVRLRTEAGIKGDEKLSLPKGSVLYDLENISDFTTKLKINEVQYDEPWLKVRTPAGEEGWVYAATVRFEQSQSSQNAILLNRRLQSFFGRTLAIRTMQYRQRFEKIASAQDLAETYQDGMQLRDTLSQILKTQITINDPNSPPDLFWLNQAMPAYVAQLVAEGTAYHLFNDYKQWLSVAQKTPTPEDDAFINTALAIYPMDSVEFFFPAWTIQTWDYGGSNLLGEGVLQKILGNIDKNWQQNKLFAPELLMYKNALVNDITGENTSFWYSKELVLKELDTILQHNYAILTPQDIIALRTKRNIIAQAEKNGVALNVRAGEH